ncbi:MAG: hypothetical protein AAF585_27110, partial [Verrucomicrobiota bacterium]
AWSPDGRQLLSADGEGVLRVWDAETGQLLKMHCQLPEDQAATIDCVNNEVIWSTRYAWRHLTWRTWNEEKGEYEVFPI